MIADLALPSDVRVQDIRKTSDGRIYVSYLENKWTTGGSKERYLLRLLRDHDFPAEVDGDPTEVFLKTVIVDLPKGRTRRDVSVLLEEDAEIDVNPGIRVLPENLPPGANGSA